MIRAAIFSLMATLFSACAVLDVASLILPREETAEAGEREDAHSRVTVRKSLDCAERRLAALVALGAEDQVRNAVFHARRDAEAADRALAGGDDRVARRRLADLGHSLDRISEWMVVNGKTTPGVLRARSDADAGCVAPPMAYRGGPVAG